MNRCYTLIFSWIWMALATVSVQAQQQDNSCPPPTQLFAWDIGNRNANVSWNPPAGVVNYEVRFREKDTPFWNNIQFPVFNPPYSFTGLREGTEYEVAIRSRCVRDQNFVVSAWSESIIFKTLLTIELCPPPVEINLFNPTNSTINISYDLPASVVFHNINYREITERLDLPFQRIEGVQGSSYILERLKPDTEYEITVEHVCRSSKSIPSQPKRLRTLPGEPCNPPILALEQNRLTDVSAQVSWTPVVTSYIISYRIQGVGPWIGAEGQSPPPYRFNGLLRGTLYEARIQQLCSGNESDFSNIVVFRTLETPPCLQPNMDTVAVSDIAATVRWDVDIAGGYEIQYRVRNSPANFTNLTNTTPPPFAITGLQPNTEYEVRMRQSCSASFSEFSPLLFFRTKQRIVRCPPPEIAVSSITNRTAVISLDPPLERYEVSFRVRGAQTPNIIRDATLTTFVLNDLAANTLYQVWVRQQCADFPNSTYSDTIEFRTTAQPPSCISPTIQVSNITDNSAIISWGENIDEYEVAFRLVGANTFTRVNGSEFPFTLASLTRDSQYEVFVRQSCGSEFSAESNRIRFRTLREAPACLAPFVTVGNITNLSANVRWIPTTIGRYEVSYRSETNPVWIVINNSGGTSLNLSRLEPGVRYEVRMRQNCSGAFSEFSNIAQFTTVNIPNPCATPALSIGQVQDQSVTLTWTNTLQRYEIDYRVRGAAEWITLADRAPSPYIIRNLTRNADYEVRMRQLCGDTLFSTDTRILNFSTNERPDCPTPTFTIDNTTVTDVGFTLTWQPVTIREVEVSYRKVGETEFSAFTPTTQNPYEAVGLEPASNYEIRIRQKCDIFFSDPSTTRSISTLQPNPCTQPNVRVLEVQDEEVTITWNQTSPVFEVSYKIDTAQNWVVVNAGGTVPFRLTGLTKSTSYQLRVRQRCDRFVSNYSRVVRFTTLAEPAPCLPPQVNIDRISDESAFISWTPSAAVYELSYRESFTEDWTDVLGADRPPFILRGLQPRTAYDVRVRNACRGNFTEFSIPLQFTTLAPLPACPIADNFRFSDITTSSAVASWTTVRPVDSFKVSITTNNGISYLEVGTVREPRITLRGLAPGKFYAIRVQSFCPNFKESQLSVTASFNSQPGPPRCPAPADLFAFAIRATTVKVGWSTIISAEYYEMEVSPDSGKSWRNLSSITSPPMEIFDLIENVNYWFRVRAFCGEWSTYSDTLRFVPVSDEAPCAPPIITVANVTDTSARISWAPVTESYELQFKRAGRQPWRSMAMTAPSPLRLDTLKPNTTYWLRIRNVCSATRQSVFSDSVRIQTSSGPPIACPRPVLETGAVTSRTITLTADTAVKFPLEVSYRAVDVGTWTVIPFFTRRNFLLTDLTPDKQYLIRARQKCDTNSFSTFSDTLTANTLAAINECRPPQVQAFDVRQNTAFMSWEPAMETYEIGFRNVSKKEDFKVAINTSPPPLPYNQLPEGDTFQVRMRRYCRLTDLFSDYSNVVTFRTTRIQPDCPVPPAPFPLRVFHNRIDVGFTANPNANDYEVSYSADGGVTWEYVQNVKQSPVPLSELRPNTRYRVRVRYMCNGAYSGFSQPINISTAETAPECEPIVISEVGLTDTTARINWAIRTAGYEVSYRQANEKAWTELNSTAARPYTLRGLTRGTNYVVRVRYVCSGSFSNYSNLLGITTTGRSADTLPGGGNGEEPFNPNCPRTNLTFESLTNTSIVMSWPDTIDQHQISYRPVGTEAWTTTSTLNEQPWRIPNLTPATRYQARIRRMCPSGPSRYSDTIVFRTLDSASRCRPPVLSVDGTSNVSAQLSWGLRSGRFDISYRKKGAGRWVRLGGIEDTPYILESLEPSTEYESRVREFCDTSFSDFSNTVTFRTLLERPICGTPFIAASAITNTAARLRWSPAGPGFEISYRAEGITSWTLVFGQTVSEFALANLMPNTKYFVLIRNVCIDVFSDYSNLIEFRTTGTVPSCDAPIVLVNQVTDSSAVVNWSPNVEGAQYELSFRPLGADNWLTQLVRNVPSITLGNLTKGTEYEVRIRLICQQAISPYSNVARVRTTAAPEPCLVPQAFVGAIQPTAATVNWAPFTASYELSYQAQGDATPIVVQGSGQPFFVLNSLRPNTAYRVWVRNQCANGGVSERSNELSFTTPGTTPNCPPPSLSFGSITASSIALNWQPVLTQYEISYREVGSTVWRILTGNAPPPFQITGLRANTAYEVRMRQRCLGQFSSFSNVLRVNTLSDLNSNCPEPVMSVLSTSFSSVRLGWEPSAEGFELSYREAAANTWTIVSGTGESTVELRNLKPGTTYFAVIRNRCGIQFSSYTGTLRFETAAADGACPVPSLTLRDTTATGVSIFWDRGPNVTIYEVSYRLVGTAEWQRLFNTTPPPFVLTNLNRNSNYEVRVRNFCIGNSSSFSESRFFTTRRFGREGIAASTSAPVESSVLIYPNPVRDQFNLEWQASEAGSVMLTIVNVQGAVVWSESYSAHLGLNVWPVSIPPLSAGMYIVRMSGPGLEIQQKLQVLND
jgi:hypothetical protein